MRIGIVGSGADKFTPETEKLARRAIRSLLHPGDVVVSGASPLGGIDVWSIEEAKQLGLDTQEHPPLVHQWGAKGGYKDRNCDIAHDSEKVVCIVPAEYPPGYRGMRFDLCYHCKTKDHIKSGGCWTRIQAERLGKRGQTIIIHAPHN